MPPVPPNRPPSSRRPVIAPRRPVLSSQATPKGAPPKGPTKSAKPKFAFKFDFHLPSFQGGPLAHLLIKVLLWCGILAGSAVFGVVVWYGHDMPDIRQVVQPERAPSVTILADDGSVFARYGDLVGKYVTLADVPPYLPQAIIAIEDRRFYSHFGVDVFGILRAGVRNMLAGHTVQGGSTLTQQLAKNLFLTPERTFKRKVQEMLLALQLERAYSKDQILTAYINRVYLGAGAYGVDAAAQTYFGKTVKEIDLREAAVLAGLLRAPTQFSPARNPALAMSRADVVLQAMVEAGYLTEEQRTEAGANVPLPRRKPGAAGDGRYFADWIVQQVNGLLQEVPADVIVSTTIDTTLQRTAERHLDSILAAEGSSKNAAQAALITLAPDGGVRALVGGRDYGESKFNRATQAKRQPGSSFKPLIYLTALEQGMSPDEMLEDAPIQIGNWSPENYEKKFLGMVTARTALAESINTVAVRLLQKVGIPATIKTAHDLGITSDLEENLSLALGTSVVTPMEMVGVYASMASGGRLVMPYAIKEIRSQQGEILYRRQDMKMPIVADPHAVATLVDMMKDVIRSGTGKRANLGRPAAGKTGTSSDYRDAWFMGFTADYTTGVWFGNDNNESMKKVTGGGLPAQLWHDFMIDAEANMPARELLPDAPQAEAPKPQDPQAAPAQQEGSGDALGGLIKRLTGGAN